MGWSNRMTQRTHAELEAALSHLRESPSDDGLIEMIVRRPAVGAREVLQEAMLDTTVGLVGDTWDRRGSARTKDGSPHPELQITVMNSRLVDLVAGSRDRWSLAGDQFYVDFDLSAINVPPGTRLKIGDAVVEVSAIPHTGCGKFVSRFGLDAMKFVNSAVGRQLNLRGIHGFVVKPGLVRNGDRISREAS